MAFRPVISIGMPVFNCEKTVAQAIRSVLSQEYSNWELVIIDDGSTDDTARIVKQFTDTRIRFFHYKDNRKLHNRLNEAVALSQGEFFARMDGDDVMYPERLRIQYEYMREHPEVDLVGGGVLVFRGDGEPLGTRAASALTHEQICAKPWRGLPIPHPTWMGRAEWFRRNPYPQETRAEDQALLLRTFRRSRFARTGDIILGYREDSLPAVKVFLNRKNATRAFIRHLPSKRDRLLAALKQSVAGSVEMLAAVCSIEHLLRNRALPANAEQLRLWNNVWSGVSQG